MSGLLELKDKLKRILSEYEVVILPIVKFLLAFIVLNVINGSLGYMRQLDNIAIVLIVSLLCSFLPMVSIALFGVLFSLGHMYALSIEAVAVGFCIYIVMFLLFFRFSPREILVTILTPVLFVLKIPYVMPVAMGLLGTPASGVSVGLGVFVYYMINTISLNATTLTGMGDDEMAAKFRLLIDGVIGNKAMLITIAAFVVTVLVVYILRRMSADYSWTIAIVAGAFLDMIVILLGDLMYDTNISIVNILLGAVITVVVAKVIEFFNFCVDYSRTEKVQFEDDEYYYYVKAVPKMTVAEQTKTVKKINRQTRSVTINSAMTDDSDDYEDIF